MKKRVRSRITKGEKILYLCGCISIAALFFLPYFASAKVGNLSLKIEKLKYDITLQEKKNESLTMQINELTAFANVKKVVNEMGLAYNNNNIVVIND